MQGITVVKSYSCLAVIFGWLKDRKRRIILHRFLPALHNSDATRMLVLPNFFFFLPAQEGSRRQWSSPGNVLERKAVPQPVLWPWLWTSAPRSCWLPSNLGHSLYPAFEVFNSFYWTFIPFHSFTYLFIYLHLQFWAWTGNQQLRLVSIFPFCLVLHIFEIE